MVFNDFAATVEDWDKIFAVNARGVFLCYKYAAEQMIKQGYGGRIIGACSSSGKRGEAQTTVAQECVAHLPSLHQVQ